MAISNALVALGYLELPEADQPPEEIWHHNERLQEWFKAVKQNRENPGMEPIEEVDDDDPTMMRNELLAELMGDLDGDAD